MLIAGKEILSTCSVISSGPLKIDWFVCNILITWAKPIIENKKKILGIKEGYAKYIGACIYLSSSSDKKCSDVNIYNLTP